MSRSVNKVILIGNLTRDPELRYTPQGNAVASFVIATNREWNTDGTKKEVVDFHNIVAWNKLAELCGQLLTKGSKVYVEGRLQTRDWTDDSGTKKYKTEVVIDEMIILTNKRAGAAAHDDAQGDAEPEAGNDTPDQDIDLDKVLNEDFNQ